jgi:hypothetical protein
VQCNITPLLFIVTCAFMQPLTAWSAAPDCRAGSRNPLATEPCPANARSSYPLAHLFENSSESKTSLALAAVLLGVMAMRARVR